MNIPVVVGWGLLHPACCIVCNKLDGATFLSWGNSFFIGLSFTKSEKKERYSITWQYTIGNFAQLTCSMFTIPTDTCVTHGCSLNTYSKIWTRAGDQCQNKKPGHRPSFTLGFFSRNMYFYVSKQCQNYLL